jgi:hypothetical protein
MRSRIHLPGKETTTSPAFRCPVWKIFRGKLKTHAEKEDRDDINRKENRESRIEVAIVRTAEVS